MRKVIKGAVIVLVVFVLFACAALTNSSTKQAEENSTAEEATAVQQPTAQPTADWLATREAAPTKAAQPTRQLTAQSSNNAELVAYFNESTSVFAQYSAAFTQLGTLTGAEPGQIVSQVQILVSEIVALGEHVNSMEVPAAAAGLHEHIVAAANAYSQGATFAAWGIEDMANGTYDEDVDLIGTATELLLIGNEHIYTANAMLDAALEALEQ